MDIISTEKGSYDLSTNKGQYGYVCEYLVAHGARGDILSCMEKLYKNAQENARLREALKLYADPKSFKDKIDNETSIPDFYDETDFGMFAREALKGGE